LADSVISRASVGVSLKQSGNGASPQTHRPFPIRPWRRVFRAFQIDSTIFPPRSAWVEIDLARLRKNLRLIRSDLPRPVRLMAVLKDEAYGHGALDVARIALEEGAWGFARAFPLTRAV